MNILENHFKKRKEKVLNLIHSYNLQYSAIGLFGSYARNEYKGTSDIDFFIVGDKPDAYVSGNLREDADMLGADIVFISEDTLKNGNSLLAREIRRDMIIIEGGVPFEK